MTVLPLTHRLGNPLNTGCNPQGMNLAILILQPFLKDKCHLRIIGITHRLELAEAGSPDGLMAYIGLVIKLQSLRSSLERQTIHHLCHRILGIPDRLRKAAKQKSTLTGDVHIHDTQSLDILDMGLDSGTIAVTTLFRKYGIVGLHYTGHDGKHIVRAPKIVLRGRIRSLAGAESVTISIEFIKILCLSSDNARFFDFPDAPLVKLSIFVDKAHKIILGTKMP